MFKDMSKLEKAGLVIGTIECVAGFGLAIYAHCKLKKQANDLIENIEETTEQVIETVNEIFNQED